jgi:hypothetical protein
MLEYCGLWRRLVYYSNFEGTPYNLPEIEENTLTFQDVRPKPTRHTTSKTVIAIFL